MLKFFVATPHTYPSFSLLSVFYLCRISPFAFVGKSLPGELNLSFFLYFICSRSRCHEVLSMEIVRIDGKYRLKGRLGFGSYSKRVHHLPCCLTQNYSGEVYIAHDILAGQDVVVKLEPLEGKNHTLEHEFNVYHKLGRGIGIPPVHWFGRENGFNAMVIDRLGLSLDHLFVRCNFRFSINTVLRLASQLVSDLLHARKLTTNCHAKICRLQFIHSRNFVHRDIKPSNIVMGIGDDADVAYIIDFGLSKEFRDPRTRLHIPFDNTLGLTGTPTFASISSHLGLELGRRDDLESLAYVLIYFLRGSLPWQGLDFEGHDLVVESKQRNATYELCKGLPQEFHTLLDYSRSLSFDDKPNYDYLRGLFDNSLSSDMALDWNKSNDVANEQLDTKRELFSDKLKPAPERRTG
jgi:serine/threonine protein kinase